MTSKLQVTIPKRVADHYGIKPGDDVDWVAAGDVIRVIPAKQVDEVRTVQERLRVFDAATARQRRRGAHVAGSSKTRGWRREELYDRGRPD